MQLDERIGVMPVATGRMATIDERHMDIGVIDECVGKRHAHRTGPDDEVVRLDCSRHLRTPPSAE
ncbi:hypothetical protein D3C72_2317340 [compost metagenome]